MNKHLSFVRLEVDKIAATDDKFMSLEMYNYGNVVYIFIVWQMHNLNFTGISLSLEICIIRSYTYTFAHIYSFSDITFTKSSISSAIIHASINKKDNFWLATNVAAMAKNLQYMNEISGCNTQTNTAAVSFTSNESYNNMYVCGSNK